jgi:hypothetical protein
MTVPWQIRAWLVVILLLGLFARPSPVLACSCSEPRSPAIEFAQAGAVFRGEVTRIRETARGYRVDFAVRRSWKGILTENAQVSTGSSDADCGYDFQVGAEYVVYAYDWGDGWNTHSCSRTTEVSRAAEDLGYLDTLDPLVPASTLPSSWGQPGVISLTIAGSLLILVTIWLWRRRRHTGL